LLEDEFVDSDLLADLLVLSLLAFLTVESDFSLLLAPLEALSLEAVLLEEVSPDEEPDSFAADFAPEEFPVVEPEFEEVA